MSTLLEEPDEIVNTGQPKYRLLADRLRAQIESRELSPGDRLPSFAEMREHFGVTTTTVERVYGLLEQEGLVERQPRRGLFVAEQKRVLTGNIGIIGTPALRQQQIPFYVHIHQGVNHAASEYARRLLLETNEDWSAGLFEMVDGLLLIGHSQRINREILDAAPAHLGRVSMLTSVEGITCVVADEYGAGKLAVQHLVEKGHRRIACLMAEDDGQAGITGRLVGYDDAMREAGLQPDEAWKRIVPTFSPYSNSNFLTWSRGHMRAWLEEGWRELGCTAIVAQNDHTAIGVMQVLSEAGIKVPEEVSVIGFDGTELCDHVMPRLTSVRLPVFEMGIKAMEMLVRQIESGKQEAQTIVLPAKLRQGDSVTTL